MEEKTDPGIAKQMFDIDARLAEQKRSSAAENIFCRYREIMGLCLRRKRL